MNVIKKGFTLIEVIISIFILAVVISIILDLNKEISKNILFTMEQSDDFSTIDIMYGVLFQKAFDENNTQSSNYIYSLDNKGIKFLQIERKGKEELDNNKYRKGTKDYTLSKIGTDENENNYIKYDDIDDFNNFNKDNIHIEIYYSKDEFSISADEDKGEYNITYNYDPADEPLSASTNIKTINITYKQENDQNITFHYNMYNIGSSKLLSLKNILYVKPVY